MCVQAPSQQKLEYLKQKPDINTQTGQQSNNTVACRGWTILNKQTTAQQQFQ